MTGAELTATLQRARVGLPDALRLVGRDVAEDGAAAARERIAARLQQHTGRLRGSLRVEQRDDSVTLSAGEGIRYARVQELGALIRARRGWLVFTGRNGAIIRARQVRVAGVHYLSDAVDAVAPTVPDRIDRQLGRLLEGA